MVAMTKARYGMSELCEFVRRFVGAFGAAVVGIVLFCGGASALPPLPSMACPLIGPDADPVGG